MVEKIVYAPGASAASADGVGVNTEKQMREEFEKTCGGPRSVERNTDGEYKLMQTYRGWIDFKLGWQAALSSLPRMSEEEMALFGRFKTMLEKEEQVYEASFGCGDDANEAEVNIDFASLFGFTVDEFQSVLALIAKLPHIVREA